MAMGLSRGLEVGTSYLVSGLRAAGGMYVTDLGPRPEQRLELYDFEACPFCRKVREALSVLDLEALILPCPRGGTRFRPKVKEMGGKTMFPYLVDPGADLRTYESDDIIRHLFRSYGASSPPVGLRLGPLTALSSSVASLARARHGLRARPSRAPAKPLELWSFEASPYCRLAREVLCELEIPYVLHNVAKNSPSREAFVARSGRMMVPYLADPNTGAEMHESGDILLYLEQTYALG